MKIIEEISSRLRFLVTLSILFPALMSSFFKITGNSEDFSNSVSFSWGFLISLLVFNYFFFELLKSRLGIKFLTWINRFYLIEIGAFIIPIFLFTSKNIEMGLLLGMLFIASLLTLIIIPAALGLIFFVKSIFYISKKN